MEENLRNYSFVLDWDDLDEDLRTQKVADYIDHQEANGAYAKLNEEDLTEDERTGIKIRSADSEIRKHFPLYF